MSEKKDTKASRNPKQIKSEKEQSSYGKSSRQDYSPKPWGERSDSFPRSFDSKPERPAFPPYDKPELPHQEDHHPDDFLKKKRFIVIGGIFASVVFALTFVGLLLPELYIMHMVCATLTAALFLFGIIYSLKMMNGTKKYLKYHKYKQK